MTTSQILREARKLIEKPENWTQGAYARDKDGNEVDVCDDAACCFCSMGAVALAAGGQQNGALARMELTKFTLAGVAAFNDVYSHAEVLSLFSKAIAAAEASEAGR